MSTITTKAPTRDTRTAAVLRTEATLLANTLQGTAAQFAVGVVTALSFIIAEQIDPSTSTATYAFMETAIGVGNLIGGFALGLIATRVAKGRLIIAAYTMFGLLVILWVVSLVVSSVVNAILGVSSFGGDPLAAAERMLSPLGIVLAVVRQTVTTVVVSAAVSVLYVELRRAREGLGPEWLRDIFT